MKLSCRAWSGAHLSKAKALPGPAAAAGKSATAKASKAPKTSSASKAPKPQAAQPPAGAKRTHQADPPSAAGAGGRKTTPRNP